MTVRKTNECAENLFQILNMEITVSMKVIIKVVISSYLSGEDEDMSLSFVKILFLSPSLIQF